jgi:uncharacterized protein
MSRMPARALRLAFALITAWCAWLAPAQAQRAACPPPLPAAAPDTAPKDRGLLWKATRDGRTLHLFGTLHVGKPQWRKLGPLTVAALRSADVLALELDPNDPALQQAMAELRHPAVPEPLQQRLQRAYERACMSSEQMAALHPLLQATTLTVMEARWLGMDSVHALEQVLIAQHRPEAAAVTPKAAARRVVALESVQVQLQVLVPGDETEANSHLEQTLQALEDQSAPRAATPGRGLGAGRPGGAGGLRRLVRMCRQRRRPRLPEKAQRRTQRRPGRRHRGAAPGRPPRVRGRGCAAHDR